MAPASVDAGSMPRAEMAVTDGDQLGPCERVGDCTYCGDAKHEIVLAAEVIAQSINRYDGTGSSEADYHWLCRECRHAIDADLDTFYRESPHWARVWAMWPHRDQQDADDRQVGSATLNDDTGADTAGRHLPASAPWPDEDCGL